MAKKKNKSEKTEKTKDVEETSAEEKSEAEETADSENVKESSAKEAEGVDSSDEEVVEDGESEVGENESDGDDETETSEDGGDKSTEKAGSDKESEDDDGSEKDSADETDGAEDGETEDTTATDDGEESDGEGAAEKKADAPEVEEDGDDDSKDGDEKEDAEETAEESDSKDDEAVTDAGEETGEEEMGEKDEGKKVKMVTKKGTQTASAEMLAKKIESQLTDAQSSDVVTFRFRKQTVLIAIGVALLTMWLVPLGQLVWSQVQTSEVSVSQLASGVRERLPFVGEPQNEAVGENEAAQTPEEASPGADEVKQSISIRLRNTSESEEAGEAMRSYLEQAGYSDINLVYDPSSEFEGIQVVTKEETQSLKQQVESDLVGEFQTASTSATLTPDSDFDVVIILGNQ